MARAAGGRRRRPDRLRRGLGLALIWLLSTPGALAQGQAPPVEDLAQFQGELREVLAEVDDGSFEEFALELVSVESDPARRLGGVDWDLVFEGLREEALRRETLTELSAELAYRHGASLVARGDWAAAETALLEALEQLDEDDPQRGWVQCSRAQVAVSEQRWTEGLELLDQAEDVAPPGERGESLRAWVQRRRDEAWVLIGMPELALESLDARWNAAIARADQDRRVLLAAFEHLANALVGADEFEAMQRLEQQLQPVLEGGPWSPQERAVFESYFATAEVDGGLRSPARARRGRERLERLIEGGALSGLRTRWCLEWLALAHLDAGDASAALEVVERLERLAAAPEAPAEDPGRVVRVALRARAELGLDRARPVLEQRLAEVREAWGSQREGWSRVPTRDGGVGYLLLSSRQGLIEALLGLLDRIEGPERGAESALEWLVEAQTVSTLARRLDAPQTSFAGARSELLDGNRGLLAWVPLRNTTYLLAADGTRSRMFVLAPSFEVEGRVTELLDALGERLSDRGAEGSAFDAAVERATAALLPAEALAFVEGWGELYLCGLDDLGFVPFELLDDGSGGTQGTRRAIARLPSIPVGLVLAHRARHAVREEVCVVLADQPEPEAAREYGVEPLRTGGAEEDTLFADWGAYPLAKLAGQAASYEALSARLEAGVGFVHVVGHGVRRRDERPQGILFASVRPARGAVFAEEIEALRAPELVVLSVCGANRSRLRRGDGSRSDLTSAWFVAGAAATASASTDLTLGPTLRVGASVQAALRQGLPLAEALRAARARASDERERLTAHLLQVAGAGFDARLPERGGADGKVVTWLVTGGALACAALAWAWSRRRARPDPFGDPGARSIVEDAD